MKRKDMSAAQAIVQPLLPHYAALVAKANELGWPLAYRRDLEVHDLSYCETHDAKKRFLWFIGECGTDILRIDEGRSLGAVVECSLVRALMRGGRPRVFFWDGLALCEVTDEKAIELLAERKEAA